MLAFGAFVNVTLAAPSATLQGGHTAFEARVISRTVGAAGTTAAAGTKLKGRVDTVGDTAFFVSDEIGKVEIAEKSDTPNLTLSALSLDVTAERMPDGKIRITEGEPALLADFSKVITKVPDARKADFEKTLDQLRQRLGDAIKKNQPGTQQELATSIAETQEDLVAQFLTLSPAQQEQAAGEFGVWYLKARAARKRLFDKGIFGSDDQYAPETYRHIYEKCASVGRIQHGPRVVGTGFLIGHNLILTARHCLFNASGDRVATPLINVVFDGASGTGPEVTYPVIKEVYVGGDADVLGIQVKKLDYALLELGPSATTSQKPSESGLAPVQLSNRLHLVERDDPVYVVGFPLGSKKRVADYARIFVPWNNNESAFTGFRLQLEGELANARARAEQETNPVKREVLVQIADSMAETMRANFKSSFHKVSASDAATGSTTSRWYFVSAMLAGPRSPPQPAIALDSDTFRGDSGAPVFARGTSEVIGLFIRGAPDRSDLKIGWSEHEEAIPVHVVLDDWKAAQPGGPALYGVNL